MKRYLSEFLGTFALVFAGTGAIVINSASNGVIGHAGIALTFGLIVLAMIYTFGDVSGAHLKSCRDDGVRCGSPISLARSSAIRRGAGHRCLYRERSSASPVPHR